MFVGSGSFYVLVSLGAAAFAVGVTWLVLRFTPLHPPFDFGAVDALITIVYGILLAILVLFASDHYTRAIDHADQESTALNAMYKSAGILPAATRDQLQHTIVCYAREKIALEWPALRKSDGSGSPVVFARTRQLNAEVEAIVRAHREDLTVQTLFQSNLQRATARQLMLDDSRPELPPPLWFVVLLGIAIVVFLLAVRYWHEPPQLAAALVVSLLLLCSMVVALAELDRPFASTIGLKPRAMESVLTSVVQSSNVAPSVLAPCAPPP